MTQPSQPSGGVLAFTGGSAATLATIAGAMIVSGTGLVLASKRRRDDEDVQ